MKNSAWVYFFILITVVASFAGETNNESVRSTGTDRQTFNIGPTDVFIDIPSGWQSVDGSYGIDLMILGPEVAGDRPVVSVIALGESPAIELGDRSQTRKSIEQGGKNGWRQKRGNSLSSSLCELFPSQMRKDSLSATGTV